MAAGRRHAARRNVGRSLAGTAVRLHVPHPEHVESTLWKVLGDEAVNEPRLIGQPGD
jgi:hypothetical protein